LATEFETLAPQALDTTTEDRLSECAAIAKTLACQRLAVVTGRPEATEHMLATANTIRGSDEASVVRFIANGLDIYEQILSLPGGRTSAKREDLNKANEALGRLHAKQPESVWHQVLPQSHVQLWLTSMGVVIDRLAALRSNDTGSEQDFSDAVDQLQDKLRKVNQGPAADFLLSERATMRKDWYRATVLGARDDCEIGPSTRRLRGATILERMRVIYGWWVQTESAPELLEELWNREASWLGWWSPEDEITTALCGLATAQIRPAEGKLRFERLRRELKGDRTLCPFVESELWAAGAKNLSWLNGAAKPKCAG
jgi:hypothetical protein